MSWSWCCSLLHAIIYRSVLLLLSLKQSDPWELIWVGHWQKDMRAWPSNTFDHSPPHRELGLSLSQSHGWLAFEWFSLLLFGVWNELSSRECTTHVTRNVQPICFTNLCSVEISVCFLEAEIENKCCFHNRGGPMFMYLLPVWITRNHH